MAQRGSRYIRSHVWGLIAVFVALTGTAVATGRDDGPAATTSAANPTKQVKKLKRKLASVEQRLAALEAKPSPATPTIPTSLPPSGAAGGELAGTYPNPTIGTVSGLDLASSTSASAGINFGTDTNLYRVAANSLFTDDTLSALGDLGIAGATFLGDASTDETTVVGYLNLRVVSSAPAAADCDGSPAAESGRMVFNTMTNELWVCDDSGWLQILAS